ncbi:TIGR03767 family metallophosphoesterase [Nocardioides soli]|uniref:Metallophosphoesterase (TIGR03767 family) n=1 Tax=Nocardioides soli TaxID=1036020 RepID=A0A7W4VRM0_9ACTN|nr:metallophosphoesterase (TIGR03767 family) [Nocardioides soli]
MQISRRDVLRSSAAAAGSVAALGGFGLGLADAAVAGSPTVRAAGRTAVLGKTTRTAVLAKGTAGAGGYRPVVARAGEATVVRGGLGAEAQRKRASRRRALVAFGQMSDVHICDSESPNRLENAEFFSSSAYRPGEMLGLHVAEAMVRQINRIGRGPVTRRKLDFVVQTGDNADNAQYNELRWNIDVLDGGTVRQDSGDLNRYEGVMDSSDPAFYAPAYYHPDGTPAGQVDDDYRKTYGFKAIPGLIDAARRPFDATGLDVPWYSALGNHDPLIQGNEAPDATSQAKAIGGTKTIRVGQLPRNVTPDPDRRQLSTAEIVEEHFHLVPGAPGPVGHGFTPENRKSGTGYYTFDHGKHLRFVVLDTVNHNGDDRGSLNQTQLSWLRKVLAGSRKRLVVVASHHTSWTMNSTVTGSIDPGRRVHGDELVKELLRHPNVIAWVNGHTHSNKILPHPRKKKGGKGRAAVVGGFWEINTASHIDWPQQARLIEVADNRDGTLSIFTTMIDHGAPTAYADLGSPLELAAVARELAANDPQERSKKRGGVRTSRNTELLLPAPAFLTKKKKK